MILELTKKLKQKMSTKRLASDETTPSTAFNTVEQAVAVQLVALKNETSKNINGIMDAINKLTGKIDQLEASTTALPTESPQPTHSVRNNFEGYSPFQTAHDINPKTAQSLPIFDGTPDTYTPWRKRVLAYMRQLEKFENTSQYYGTLMEVRARIIGAPDRMLNDDSVPLHLKCIITALDEIYAITNQGYTLMKQIDQAQQRSSEELIDYFHRMNGLMRNLEAQPLHTRCSDAQEFTAQAFIGGLRNKKIAEVLAGATINNLKQAYIMAQKTSDQLSKIRYQNSNSNNQQPPRRQETFPRHANNYQQSQRPVMQQRPQCTTNPFERQQRPFQNGNNNQFQRPFWTNPTPHYQQNSNRPNWGQNNNVFNQRPQCQPRPEPMEVDSSLNHRRPNFGVKRDHSAQNIVPNKIQRINTQKNQHIKQHPEEVNEFEHMDEIPDNVSSFLD